MGRHPEPPIWRAHCVFLWDHPDVPPGPHGPDSVASYRTYGERSIPRMAVTTVVTLPPRKSFSRIPDIRPMPNLIQVQIDSFEWFKREGLRELFAEISPIEDFTSKSLKLEFIVPENPFEQPKYTEEQCRERDATYAAPLYVKAL